MDDQMQFVLLVQTEAISKALQDQNRVGKITATVAYAMLIPIEDVPKNDEDGYLGAAQDYVRYQMQFRDRQPEPRPEWYQ